MNAHAFLLGRASRPYDDHTTLSYDPEGCTLLMITYTWNARQRARLAQLNCSGAENAKLAATISFKKRNYLPTIHKELRDHLMKLMVYIMTTKGYDMTSEDNDEVKFTKLTAKIDIRELNHISFQCQDCITGTRASKKEQLTRLEVHVPGIRH
ncbi:hypothetical protein KCU73_g7854, partial [Aureobasidium melanogenum]